MWKGIYIYYLILHILSVLRRQANEICCLALIQRPSPLSLRDNLGWCISEGGCENRVQPVLVGTTLQVPVTQRSTTRPACSCLLPYCSLCPDSKHDSYSPLAPIHIFQGTCLTPPDFKFISLLDFISWFLGFSFRLSSHFFQRISIWSCGFHLTYHHHVEINSPGVDNLTDGQAPTTACLYILVQSPIPRIFFSLNFDKFLIEAKTCITCTSFFAETRTCLELSRWYWSWFPCCGDRYIVLDPGEEGEDEKDCQRCGWWWYDIDSRKETEEKVDGRGDTDVGGWMQFG